MSYTKHMSNIKEILNKVINFIKENAKKVIYTLFTILFILGLFFFLGKKGGDKILTVSPTREKVVDTVEVTGQVESSKDAELAFEKTGIVSKINVKIGQNVKDGEVMASLSGNDSYASVREAEAGVEAARATLSQLESGSSEAEISLKTQNLDNARADLVNAESQIQDTLSNVKNKLSDIIDYKLNNVFYKDFSQYRMTFNSCDQTIQSQIEIERSTFSTINNLDNLTTAKSEVDKVNTFVVSLQRLFSLPCSVSDSSLSDKRASVSASKTDISSMYAEISSRNTLVLSAKNAVSRAEKDLNLSTGQDKNRIANQKASLNQAYARLAQARAQAGKNVLTAPFAGKVSEVNVELGELASQSKYAFKLISDSSYQIKSKISEIDIAKIKVGNVATVTLDAYPNAEFSAVITSIDPASKNESGVPRYGVVLTFINSDSRILSGMTSNANIVSAEKDNALTIPPSFIEIKSGGGMVKVKNGDKEEDKIVKIGLRSKNGNIEILEGLTEKDVLIEISKDGVVKR